MDLPRNHFKHALAQGRHQIGFWCSLASHISAELLAGSGFDWLLLDTEHSPLDISMALSQLQAGREHRGQPVVRPPWNDFVAIKRRLDMGAQTLLIPTINDAAEAEAAVAATRYPPRGIRGFAGASRSSRFGRIPDYHARCEAELCVLLQVETRAGLDNLEAIARVDGVDGVFIGPGDLSAALGHLDRQNDPAMQDTILDAIRRIRACGKAPGILTANEPFARRAIEAGSLFTAVGSDSGLLARQSEALAARFRQNAAVVDHG